MRQQLPQSDRLTPVEEQVRWHAWTLPIRNNGPFTDDLVEITDLLSYKETCWQDKCVGGGGGLCRGVSTPAPGPPLGRLCGRMDLSVGRGALGLGRDLLVWFLSFGGVCVAGLLFAALEPVRGSV